MASKIVDQYGQPIELSLLDEEIAGGSLMSVRQVWHDSIARGLTPAALAALLERAAHVDADDYLTLAEEMEERDPHYSAVLGVRKRAVSGLPIVVEAASEDAADVELADAVRELSLRPAFGELLDDLLDALGKSYSVCEILWERGKQWWPREYPFRDPRWFQWDRITGRKLNLRDQANPIDGIALAPFKFVVHTPRLKTGLQIRSGLARMVAFTWIAKAYAMKDWLAFAEVFGMPLRLGRYGPNATQEDVRVLKRAVASMGADAAAVLPESMKIEFVTGQQISGGNDLYNKLCDWLDRQTSKAVLGQTMTTDAQSTGLGSNQANVHNEVRGDIMRSDARDLETTLNRDLVRPFIDLNFGPQERYPKLCLHIAEPEDLKLLSESLQKLVPLGLEVEQSVIRDKFGLPEPEPGAKLLGAPQPPAPAPPDEGQENPASNRRTAMNRMQQRAQRDELDRIADTGLEDWEAQLDPIMTAVQSLADASQDADAFLARLPEVLIGVAPEKLTRALAIAAMKARGLGDATDDIGAR